MKTPHSALYFERSTSTFANWLGLALFVLLAGGLTAILLNFGNVQFQFNGALIAVGLFGCVALFTALSLTNHVQGSFFDTQTQELVYWNCGKKKGVPLDDCRVP